MRLQELIPTFIQPDKKPRYQLNKWRIIDDDGLPITTPQGSGLRFYKEHPDEAMMLKHLRKAFPGYDVVSIPDVHNLTHCLFEARQAEPIEAEAPAELATSHPEPAMDATGSLFL